MVVGTDGTGNRGDVRADRPAAARRGPGRTPDLRRPLAWSAALLCAGMAGTTVALAVLNGRTAAWIVLDQGITTLAVLSVSFAVVGAFLASRRPGNPLGWLFCAAAVCQGAVVLAEEYALYALRTRPGSLPLGAEASWLKEWIWAPGLGLILVFLPLLFPDGHPTSRRWWSVGWVGGGAIGLCTALLAVPLWPERASALLLVDGNAEEALAPRWVLLLDTVAVPLLLLAACGALLSLAARLRRADGAGRRQMTWFLAAVVLCLVYAIALVTLPAADGGSVEAGLVLAGLLVVPAIPVATGIAVLRYRLHDIDLVLNRAVVYGLLVAVVTGCYVAAVATVGALVSGAAELAVSLVATGVVAVAFAPLRGRLQRAVNRLMYGDRGDPYAVLARFNRQVESAPGPQAVLQAVAESVARALRLPHAAVDLRVGERFQCGAEVGTPVGRPLVLPLSYAGQPLGRIVASPRGPGESFDAADRRLLGELARSAGVAVQAVRLTGDLQRSRERLVIAREEERRRLRRTLHDDVGPALSSAVLKLGAVRRMLPPESPADDLLRVVREDVRTTVSGVRALAYDLRPPVLDQLGLVAAVTDAAERLAGAEDAGDLRVDVVATPLPALPAAVEVAAFRIALEALTNAARHAAARTCRVRFRLDGPPDRPRLLVSVADDGAGLPSRAGPGVGTSSMRERAEELGGTLTLESAPGAGTTVRAALPFGTDPS
ncbi:sensor histidine kinase [Geodermatophilus sp. YIM 151500]|uniref:GAF domain-containing sensor histidine kinase n=1 Tax=Geodermatophilus sp. YIM 151500 TaxID=2984531 RepID=UPI0021E39676|nr:sensor histidine kinase [Geodermatophilus sp. YIM 151500]MCV2489738.1 sensor histidine kinase [Geodermatophilus sp. YIM 151500]